MPPLFIPLPLLHPNGSGSLLRRPALCGAESSAESLTIVRIYASAVKNDDLVLSGGNSNPPPPNVQISFWLPLLKPAKHSPATCTTKVVKHCSASRDSGCEPEATYLGYILENGQSESAHPPPPHTQRQWGMYSFLGKSNYCQYWIHNDVAPDCAPDPVQWGWKCVSRIQRLEGCS